MKGLSLKQENFCVEYVRSGNATDAYKKAGYSAKNDNVASAAAQRLLRNVKVQNRINELMSEINTPKIAEATEVLEYLTSVMRGESVSHEIVGEGVGEGCSAARIMEKPPSEKERTKAAELLGKRYSLFSDNVNVAGAVPVTIVDDMNDED